jgi:hypothetical protein
LVGGLLVFVVGVLHAEEYAPTADRASADEASADEASTTEFLTTELLPAPAAEARPPADLSTYNMARIRYDSVGGMGEAFYYFEGRVWARWETDFPQAEENFAQRLKELTRIDTAPKPALRRLTDPDLGDFPMVFMSDAGYLRFSDEEAAALGSYLRNGGFLWVDDFWGDAEWLSFERLMNEALPGVRWQELDVEHPVFHTVFDIDEMPQIPARSFADPWGPTDEPVFAHRYPQGSLKKATMRGFVDDQGRLLAIGTHNTDIADGWEREAYGQWYFERFSTLSYRLAVNVIVYVMTH